MKPGTESKTKQRVAIGLVIVAIVSVTWALVSSSGSSSEPAPVASVAVKGKPAPKIESLDPRLRLDLLSNSEDVKYEGTGTNIFRAGAERVVIPAVRISPLMRRQQAEAQRNTYIPPPPPPPINLKYFGITNSKGERPKAFLSQGEDVWIAHEGDVVNRHYKIVRILPNSIEVEDLLNNNRQNIRLTEG
jgi:hypothetical protein